MNTLGQHAVSVTRSGSTVVVVARCQRPSGAVALSEAVGGAVEDLVSRLDARGPLAAPTVDEIVACVRAMPKAERDAVVAALEAAVARGRR